MAAPPWAQFRSAKKSEENAGYLLSLSPYSTGCWHRPGRRLGGTGSRLLAGDGNVAQTHPADIARKIDRRWHRLGAATTRRQLIAMRSAVFVRGRRPGQATGAGKMAIGPSHQDGNGLVQRNWRWRSCGAYGDHFGRVPLGANSKYGPPFDRCWSYAFAGFRPR
jgi:hypothetical protein